MSGSAPAERWAPALYVNGASPNIVGDLSGSVRVRLALDPGPVDADDTHTALSR